MGLGQLITNSNYNYLKKVDFDQKELHREITFAIKNSHGIK